VVSGLLTPQTDAPTARILDGIVHGKFAFVLSLALLAEYRGVLLRPRICRRHGLTAAQVDTILTEIVANGRMAEGSQKLASTWGDDHLRVLLAEVPGGVLVTGDRALARQSQGGARVVSPREFLALIEE
jgi:predicted nucleic acid-binding protein